MVSHESLDAGVVLKTGQMEIKQEQDNLPDLHKDQQISQVKADCLPDELWLAIFNNLSDHELASSTSGVSPTWREFSRIATSQCFIFHAVHRDPSYMPSRLNSKEELEKMDASYMAWVDILPDSLLLAVTCRSASLKILAILVLRKVPFQFLERLAEAVGLCDQLLVFQCAIGDSLVKSASRKLDLPLPKTLRVLSIFRQTADLFLLPEGEALPDLQFLDAAIEEMKPLEGTLSSLRSLRWNGCNLLYHSNPASIERLELCWFDDVPVMGSATYPILLFPRLKLLALSPYFWEATGFTEQDIKKFADHPSLEIVRASAWHADEISTIGSLLMLPQIKELAIEIRNGPSLEWKDVQLQFSKLQHIVIIQQSVDLDLGKVLAAPELQSFTLQTWTLDLIPPEKDTAARLSSTAIRFELWVECKLKETTDSALTDLGFSLGEFWDSVLSKKVSVAMLNSDISKATGCQWRLPKFMVESVDLALDINQDGSNMVDKFQAARYRGWKDPGPHSPSLRKRNYVWEEASKSFVDKEK